MTNIAGSISKMSKGGRVKVLSSVLLCFVVLLMVFSVYSVFGEGTSGGAVAGSGGEPSGDGKTAGKFVDCEKCIQGWKYVEGGKVYTANSELNTVTGELFASSGIKYVKEDNTLKGVRDAKSMKGYIDPVRIEDWTLQEVFEYYNFSVNLIPLNERNLSVVEFVYENYNYTDVDIRIKLNNVPNVAFLLNENIPVKKEGVVQGSVKLSSADVFSDVISLHDDGGFLGKNVSVGFTSATDTFVSNLSTYFKNAIIFTDAGSLYFGGGGESLTLYVYDNGLGTGHVIALLWVDIVGLGVSGTIEEANLSLFCKTGEACGNTFEVYNVGVTDWEEPAFTYDGGTHGNASGADPHNNSVNYGWTNTTGHTGAYHGTNLFEGSIGAGGSYYNITLNPAGVQEWLTTNNGIALNPITVGSYTYISSRATATPWELYAKFTPNTAPSNPVVSLSPLDGFKNVDVYCTGSVNDAEGGTLTVDVDVFKNNVSQFVLNNNPAFNNVDFNFTIDSANFSVGDEWGCGMRVYDQTVYSSWVNATQFTVIQNRYPNFDPISDITVDEDFANFTINLNENISDNDEPNANLQISYDLNVSDVIVDVVNGTNNLTVASFTPDWSGSVNITLTVVDTGGLTNSTSFDLIINPVNDAPRVYDGNSSSLNRTGVGYGNETSVIFQENETIEFAVNASDAEGDQIWYDWFVDNVLEFTSDVVSYFDFATGWASAGTYNVTTHVRDYSELFSFFEWFVTVKNVNNPNFAVNFVTPPTPNNSETVHTDYVDLAVNIQGPAGESPELVSFFDDNNTFDSGEREFNQTGIPANSNFINLSDGYTTGTFQSRIYNATTNTSWDNISWGGVLPVGGEITPDSNTALLFHMNNDSDGENDTFIYDFSNNGNNGTSVGATPTPNGNISGGFIFDGSNDYIDCGNGVSLDVTSEATWEFWAYLDSHRAASTDDGQVFVSKQGTGSGERQYVMNIGQLSDWKKLIMNIRKQDDSTWVKVIDSANFPVQQWVFVAATYDKTASPSLKLYRNGVLVASDDSYHGDIRTGGNEPLIVGSVGGTGWFFDGTLDEVAVWNKILTNEDISSHANATYIGGEIKFQVKSCDDDSCSGEVFKGPTGETDYYETSTGQDLVNLPSNNYFQYKAFFSTNTAGTSPELYNVTIEGYTVVEPPELNIDSAWVDWAGNNITLNGSGLSWYGTMGPSLAENNYVYRVYANDSYDNSNATEERTIIIKAYDINFSAVDSWTKALLSGTIDIIICSNGLIVTSPVPNPTGPYNFYYGTYECNFTKSSYYDQIITFTADSDETIEVPMSFEKQLTIEEHSWLEALYDCVINGNCVAFEMWNSTNQTVEKVWKQYLPTDESVVVNENVTSYELSSTKNISLDYSVNIPIKEGYSDGDLLPIRIFYWFTDNDGNCYNQDKQSDSNRAETPYCIPLMAETLGPMNGNKVFKVDLRPNLPAGTYNITRSIEIDPQGVWNNYGRETIGTITVLEDSGEAGISIGEVKTEFVEQQTEEHKFEEERSAKESDKEAESSLSKITGSAISDILSSTKVNFVIGLLVAILFVLVCLTFRVSKLTYKK